MTTLFTASLELAKILHEVHEGTATGGSTTTLDDSLQLARPDFFKYGTLWIKSGALANKHRYVTDYDASLGRFTFAIEGALAVVANDTYAAASSRFPFTKFQEALNQAVKSLPGIPAYDTSLTLLTDTLEYTLPSGVYNVDQVEVAQDTAAPFEWLTLEGWEEIGGTLRLPNSFLYDPLFTVNYKLRLRHRGEHAEITTDSGVFSPYIHIDLLKWTAAAELLRIMYRRPENEAATLWEEAIAQRAIMRKRHRVAGAVQPNPKLASYMDDGW